MFLFRLAIKICHVKIKFEQNLQEEKSLARYTGKLHVDTENIDWELNLSLQVPAEFSTTEISSVTRKPGLYFQSL